MLSLRTKVMYFNKSELIAICIYVTKVRANYTIWNFGKGASFIVFSKKLVCFFAVYFKLLQRIFRLKLESY
jgi:hypothetical protein